MSDPEATSQVLKQLHVGHLRMSWMKLLGRAYVHCPGIDKTVEELVQQCQKCAAGARQPAKTTLAPWSVREGPWFRLHIDYVGPFKGRYFLVVVDALSKRREIQMTSSTNSTATVRMLREIFARRKSRRYCDK